MTIHWFPGHMNKTRQALAAQMPKCDVVIELLDARLPFSSANPLLDGLRRGVQGKGPEGRPGDVPCITLLTKADLAAPAVTEAWRADLRERRGVLSQAVDLTRPVEVRRLPGLIRRLAPARRLAKGLPVRTIVLGIPNVGKSTLVNALRGRKVARVGNEPAITRANQEVPLEGGILLMDTPGILWPKFDKPQVAERLALSGAIKDTALDIADIGLIAARFTLDRYPEALLDRYGLPELPAEGEQAGLKLLEAIGRRRGCLVAGGEVDLHRAADLLLRELRSGRLGRISFETPEDWITEGWELDEADLPAAERGWQAPYFAPEDEEEDD